MFIKYKNIVIFSFLRSHFFVEKLTFRSSLELYCFRWNEKQKQIDVTFLCAPGGGAIF